MQTKKIPVSKTPRSREKIRKDVYMLREKLGLQNEPCFPIAEYFELVLPIIDPDVYIKVVVDNQLKGRYAETLPSEHLIIIKQSVYDAAIEGKPFARMILAHELGHYYYQKVDDVVFTMIAHGERIPNNVDPEKQANIFAAELLMPLNVIRGKNKYEVARICGVTRRAAEVQLQYAKKVDVKCKNKRIKKKKRSKKPSTVPR